MNVRLPASVRLVAEASAFRTWLRDHPMTAAAPPPGTEDHAAGPLPPAVAAALAVQVGAEVAVSVRTWTPAGGTLTLAALAGTLGSSVSCEGVPPPEPVAAEGVQVRLWQQPHGPLGPLEGAVEVALFPAQDLVGELLRGVPASPSAVTGPVATGVQIAIAGADDVVACWQETLLAGAGRWRRVLPPDVAHLVEDAESPVEGVLLDPLPRSLQALAADLRYVVAGCLERTWTTPTDPP